MSNKEEVVQKTDQEIVNEFFQDPVIKQRHIDAAKQLYQLFKQDWFTIQKVAQKTLMKDEKQIAQLLMGLRMFNLCDAKDKGIGHKKKTHFKITLLKEERLKVLEDQKQKLLKQIEFIEKDMEKINQEEDFLTNVK